MHTVGNILFLFKEKEAGRVMIQNYRKQVKEKRPLIHCITNPISITQCANAILAVGARPIMAEHPEEVAEITETADALLLNLGNITDVRMESMKIAMREAIAHEIPVVLDVVGVACSKLRRKYIHELIEIGIPKIVKGNYSEIFALEREEYRSSGVDTDRELSLEEVANSAVKLSKTYKNVILASGKTDILTDGKEIVYMKNGSNQLASVTGTGCMLGALCACYLSVRSDIYAAASACSMLGISGELAETEKGPGSFLYNLMDQLYLISEMEIKDRIQMEVQHVERT